MILKVARENTLADPVTNAARRTRIIVRGTRRQNSGWKDLSVHNKRGSSIGSGGFTRRIACRRNDCKGSYIDGNIHRERLGARAIRVLAGGADRDARDFEKSGCHQDDQWSENPQLSLFIHTSS